MQRSGILLTVVGVLVSFLSFSCVEPIVKKVPYTPDVGKKEQERADGSGVDGADVRGGELELALETKVELADAGGLGTPYEVTAGEVDAEGLGCLESYVVGESGGTFCFPNGAVVIVPKGATKKEIVLTVAPSPESGPEDVVPVTQVWEVGPEGAKFEWYVELLLPVKGSGVKTEEWPLVKGFVKSGGTWETVPASPGKELGTVSVLTRHFSLVTAGIFKTKEGCLTEELCNGKDDDCDGETDESAVGSPCLTLGVCAVEGVSQCKGGEWVCNYDGVAGYEEGEELSCDGKDNDCDGVVDDIGGVVADLIAKGVKGVADKCRLVGVCENQQVIAWCDPVKAKWHCDYTLVNGYQGKVEVTCDGKDNNCDGETDEGVCGLHEECVSDLACKQGKCVVPLEGNKQFCSKGEMACLAIDLDGNLVDVEDGGQWCTKDLTSIVTCSKGKWGSPVGCSEFQPLHPQCDPVANVCTGGCQADEECEDDGDLCNGTPICVDGVCKTDPSTVVVCEGGVTDACNEYSCVPESGECVPTPVNEGGECDDGDPCTGNGKCVGGVCVKGAPKVIADDNECDDEVCDPKTGETLHKGAPQQGKPCDDGLKCTQADSCTTIYEEQEINGEKVQVDVGGVCVGVEKPCGDGNPCTKDYCDPEDGNCKHVPLVGEPCDDGDKCTINGICDEAGLCNEVPVNCDDFNGCTIDECDKTTGLCVHTPVEFGAVCPYPSSEPGMVDECIPFGYCDGNGVCLPGEDFCGCHTDEDCLPLDDNLCDGKLVCVLKGQFKECVEDPTQAVKCDPSGNTACLKNTCQKATGECVMTPVENGTKCEDGNACTTGDNCVDGLCVGGSVVVCDDNNSCTTDTCSPESGCKFTPVASGTPCDDSDPCTINDTCDGAGSCVPGPAKEPPCFDGDICTKDTCTPDGLDCVFEPIPGCCKTNEDCLESPGQVCFQNKCCQPVCTDEKGGVLTCGDDQCGGVCGECLPGWVCFEGHCCRPSCEGKFCGPDGCGGSCGECVPPAICTGIICCVPACENKECGDDGCGGSCGSCPVGMKCNPAGQCELCDPKVQCAGKECGPDGCGGDCGKCPDNEICLENGTCCTPQCEGKECGPDGCGGECGKCLDWETCTEGVCECDQCCESDDECSEKELCVGEILFGEEIFPICAEPLRLFFEGFEEQAPKSLCPSFKYSKTSAIPILVTEGEPGLTSHTGTRYLRYFKATKDVTSFWFNRVFPVSKPGEVLKLSFFTRCANNPGAKILLEVFVGGVQVFSMKETQCPNLWVRRVIDLSNYPAGKTQVLFKVSNLAFQAAEIKFDDFALFASSCPKADCATFTPTGGECEVTEIGPDYCFINYECYKNGEVNPAVSCAVCKPATSKLAWTPDDSLCTEHPNGVCSLGGPNPGCYYE